MPHPQDVAHRSAKRPTDLTINTASPGPGRYGDTLSTGKPPLSTRNYRSAPSSARGPGSHESFLDNETPVEASKENEPFYMRKGPKAQRDSHDLSLPSEQFTRDSLVGNMLSSLDQFSLGQISTSSRGMFDDVDVFGTPRRDEYATRTMGSTTSRPHMSHQPSHGYSYSSDFDDTDYGPINPNPRGRRSNSSSNYQIPSGARLNSMRERSHPNVPTHKVVHSRGGRTSKSSSSNSIDAGYAQISMTQRWAQSIGGRASSFDSSSQRPPVTSQSARGTAWHAEASNTFLVDDYEAAPTPNVPGGPRRSALPIAPIGTPPAPPPPESVPRSSDRERKKGSRSRSGTVKSSASRATSSTRQGTSKQQAMPPPVPPIEYDAAPAPHVGYGKAKEPQPQPAAPTPPAKEKRGFFSRVFGSSRTATPSNDASQATTPQQDSHPSTDNLDRVDSERSLQSAVAKASQSCPPSRDSPHPPPTQVIQKKSSFFRRRKKSINEPPVPTPPLPTGIDLSLVKDTSITLPEPSPVSSLRQLMNPYLDSNTAQYERPLPVSRTESDAYEEDARRRARGFSPDYEPSPNATIRTVKSHSALKTRHSMVSLNRKGSSGLLETPSRAPPDVPSKSPVGSNRDETFFNDSSDDGEGEGNRKRNSRQFRSKSLKNTPTLGVSSPHEPSPRLLLQNNVIVNEPSLRSLTLPLEGSNASRRPSTSTDAMARSMSSLPSLKIDSAQPSPKITNGDPLDEPEVTMGEPTKDDRQKAQGIYDGAEDFISKEKAAAWMGEEGLLRQRTLRAYMELYNFENLSVLSGLREICGRLVLRGETQQVDRILVAFSQRWCECNPNHGFKSTDVIHTMCYSIMLLNTDLHLADIENKMSRNQFIRNTMGTVTQAAMDSAPEAFDRNSRVPGKDGLLSTFEQEVRPSTEQAGGSTRQNWRASFLPPRTESQMGFYGDSNGEVDSCGPLVKAPFEGTMRAWELQMEIVLKEIYASIKDERLPLFGAEQVSTPQAQSQSSLSVMGMLKRSPSVLSKAPSESHASLRGRANDTKYNTTGRFSSKSRSRARVHGGMSSSRTSFEDGNSIWSPTMSSATWSRYSLGRTQTSPSMGSFDSSMPNGSYQQSIGFANALSQAIIREDFPVGASNQSIISDETGNVQLLEDETLELCGAPWMKEGMVTHKHHLDAVDKKAKERNWSEVFAVIQKGSMSLFSFSTKSMRQKQRKGSKQPGVVVGGGNWQDNATSVGNFSLRQTLATELPSPGYSPTRPHVWALSLPTGAVHLFQVGTPDIAKEFVVTVNYWSARMSTHPLVGGISNIEYGWSNAIINTALITDVAESTMPPRPGSAAAGRTSMHSHSRQNSRQSSLRSSFDVGSSSRAKLPGDKVTITEWTPPAQSMRPSNSSEADQLETLSAYVKSIEDDLQQHNQLRSPMLLTFTPRGHNSAKAMANWERKSSYLLREIVKFRTYVDGLQQAERRRLEIYTERENARRAARGEDLSDSCESGDEDFEDAEEGDVTLKIT